MIRVYPSCPCFYTNVVCKNLCLLEIWDATQENTLQSAPVDSIISLIILNEHQFSLLNKKIKCAKNLFSPKFSSLW